MNKEEAINILYNIRAYYASLTAGYPPHDCYGLGDMKCSDICKALLKGIRLLKQEPCEDVISRNAIIRTLNEMDRYVADELTLCDTNKKFPHNEVFIVDDVYEQIVEQLSPVIPQPKTGYWTPGEGICPCCGEDKFKDLDADIWADWFPKFCPNCGAKMEIKENEG